MTDATPPDPKPVDPTPVDGQPRPGRFITLEGGEGAGKSTQIAALCAWLGTRGVTAVRTREPGGAPGAEEIRRLLVTGEPGKWDAITEALLMNAARRDHVVRTIRPALARGDWVVCDRFYDSTLVYQGIAGGVPMATLRNLIDAAVEDTRPDLTLILDIDPQTGLDRAGARAAGGAGEGAETRFERKGSAFHIRVCEGFRDLAAREPERCVLIDAAQPVDAVTRDILSAVSARLRLG
ncbi:dTMP kinase [Thalassobaculum litoreum]|uniref:Thymidylate kinase n=1 Tax=Thalassobaculum litoreum DSM 18839 TaxID=1123362 RepID=A0A8G2BE49_9PROT|nr:dTMP kinase [Thalassobaculum litoreum]SDF12401.1 dTMP kinase [Thalassobaculum litoreum DSM 18839]